MIYEKTSIESSDSNQQISVESIAIPFLHKRLLSVVNRPRIVPFLDPNDSIQRNNLLSIAKKSLLTICFDVEQEYQGIIDMGGHSGELSHLYDGCLLTSPDHTISLSPNKRRDLKRLKNRLSETGEVEYLLSTEQNIDKLKFDRFSNLLKMSYNQKRVNTRWGIEKNRELLKKVLAFRGSLLFELTLNEKPIAFAHCQKMSNNRLVYMTPTYDEEYAKFSPGMQLLLNIMDYCVSNNMALDLGKGNNGYKELFDSKNYPLYAIFIFDTKIGKLMTKPIKLLLNLFIFIKRRKNKRHLGKFRLIPFLIGRLYVR